MKKIIFPLIFLLFANFGQAQVNFGARIGMNLGIFDLKNYNHDITEDYDVSQSLSVLIKMDVDVPFSTVFSFRSGLGLVIKGSEIDRIPTMQHRDTVWSILYRMNYLEVPLFIVARAETDLFGNFFFGVGPTLSLGVGGRMELFAEHRTNHGQSQTTYDLVWGNKPAPSEALHGYNHFRRFDLGLGAMFSYQLPRSGLAFTASYNRGLRNISPNPDIDLKTSYFGFSIGFIMGGV